MKTKIILWGILKRISLGLMILISVYFFIGAPMIISGLSMQPNLDDREFAWINKFDSFIRPPKRGEIVVFRFPGTRKDLYVKRVIGLPKETVEIKNNKIYINSKLLSEIYLQEDTPNFNFSQITLGENEFFVLGDNRDASNDSRIWGPLSKKYIIGKLSFVFWPYFRKRILFTPQFNI